VNVAHDGAIKVQIADQTCRIGRRKCGVDIKAVAGWIIILLRDVDLRIGDESGSAADTNEKRKFHNSETDNPHRFTTARSLFVKIYGSTMVARSRSFLGMVAAAT